MNLKKLFAATITASAFALGAQAATVDTLQVQSTHVVSPSKVVTITPDAASQGRRFPTVYLLHGFGDDYRCWSIIQPRLVELADRLEMNIVMPDGRNSWYWDVDSMPQLQMETYFVADLVPAIDAALPTIADAPHRAITGLSMGGHGALWLAWRHPDVWLQCGSTSGGVDIYPFADNWQLPQLLGPRDQHPERWRAHSVMSLLDRLPIEGMHLIIDVGNEDFFRQVNETLHAQLLERNVAHDYISRPGSHNRYYWENSILYQLLFFHETFFLIEN
jgi:S-formylglutathione hydrolase FrmB